MRFAAALVLGAGLLAESAGAQGFFEYFFGRPPPAQRLLPYADPFGGPGTARPREFPVPRSEPAVPGGDVMSYCVRLCDGRYFPVQRVTGADSGELCVRMCPAATTRIFSGPEIERAVSADGRRYAALPNAFVYRKRIVSDCTCNGKDPFGLARVDVSTDPTLRTGDIVATSKGLQAFTGEGPPRASNFTPIENYSALSPDMRKRLSRLRVAGN